MTPCAAGGRVWRGANMAYELTEADDLLHASLAADLYWTETIYLGFANLEHKLAGIIYPILRPNQGVCSLSIFLWDDSGEVGQDILYFQNFWHIPAPDDLRNIELQVGFTHRCIEPFKEYQVHYEDDVELRLDLNYLSLHEPVGRGQANVGSSYNQIYHVTGGLKLNGDELDIDCYELRGQFWGTRTDRRQVRRPDDPSEQKGYRSIVEGTRVVTRSSRGYPMVISVDALDDAGRTLHAVGETVNRFRLEGMPGIPNVGVWSSGMRWEVDGEVMWGKDDDVPVGLASHVATAPQ
jgi:hypothetical protein